MAVGNFKHYCYYYVTVTGEYYSFLLTSVMQAILECCKTLKSRIDESAKKMKLGDDISWKEKIAKCFTDGVDLTSTKW